LRLLCLLRCLLLRLLLCLLLRLLVCDGAESLHDLERLDAVGLLVEPQSDHQTVGLKEQMSAQDKAQRASEPASMVSSGTSPL